MRLLQGHSGPVRSLAYSPDGRLLASGGDDGNVFIWELESGDHVSLRASVKQRGKRKRSETPGEDPALAGTAHSDWVRAVAFSPDGVSLASAGWDGRLRLWNLQSLNAFQGRDLLQQNPSLAPSLWCLTFSVDGFALAAGDMNGQVTRILLQHSGDPLRWAGHLAPVRSLLYTPDGRTLISAGHDRTIKFWDADWGQERGSVGGHPDWICCLALSPDGRLLASGGEDGSIRLWNLDSRERVATLDGHEKRICQIAFNRSGRVLISVSWDGTIRLWDVAGARMLSALDFQLGPVHCVALAPDGMTAAVGGRDHAIVIWDLDDLS